MGVALLFLLIFLWCPVTFSAIILDRNKNSSGDDGAALMSFKSLITHDPFGALSTWNNRSLHFCQWQGVACRRHKGQLRVTALNLEDLELVGSLSPSLGNLTFLRRLHLPKNRLFGPIPNELGMLSNLHHLNLSINQLGGIIPPQLCWPHLQTISLRNNTLQGEIPANLSRCLGLQIISLANNFFSGIIPASLGALRGLIYINLANNHLEGADWAFLTALANCSKLQALELSLNRLGGALPSTIGNLSTSLKYLAMYSTQISGIIPPSIGRLINLQQLYLGSNLLRGNIPREIGNLRGLIFLSLSNNRLEGADWAFLTTLSNCINLQLLDVSLNILGGALPPSIGNLSTSLRILGMYNTQISGIIPPNIGRLINLKELYLGSNLLQGNIPHEIGNLRGLVYLYLSDNRLEGADWAFLTALANCTNLQNVDLSLNRLGGALPSSIGNISTSLRILGMYNTQISGIIPPGIGRLINLQKLYLGANLLQGNIPHEIGNLRGLVYLFLGDNHLEGADWGFLSALSNCTNLQLLNLSSNTLGGALPSSIGNLSTSLKYLAMHNAQISGIIPPSIGRLINLQQLYLGANLLHGNIPHQIGNLRGLVYLYLGNNHLEGADWAFLTALSNCTNLQNVDLSLNRLGGALPSSIGNLSTSLKYLAMYNTQISGIIPPSIGRLINLQQLYLGINLLHGNIPHEIGNLRRLWHLDISFNQISGALPSSLQNISNLKEIYLYENSLSGGLFSIFDNLTSLSIVYLSQNNFIGHIPSFFGSQSSLKALYLNSNKLIGNVPHSLGNLHSLISLFLSQNDLMGVVPNSIWNQTSLEYLNLGEDNLFGVIPLNIGETLPNLRRFNLEYNRFYGPIPDSLTNCSSLDEINLIGNTFTGRIPKNLGILKSLNHVLLRQNKLEAGQQPTDWAFLKSLGNCTKLKRLSLGNNHLSGILPSSIVNLSTTLLYLDLEANGLHGNIPAEINNLIGLNILLMNQNRFTGIIPVTMGSLQSLYYLDLSLNELSGEIPSSIGNLTKLSDLCLEYNYLDGLIPASLKNCMQMELLDLGNNRLIGSIPSEVMTISSLSRGLFLSNNSFIGALPSTIGRLINLEFLHVADNRLSGPIPKALGMCTQLRYIDFSSNLFEGTIPLSFSDLRGLEELGLSNNNLSGEIPKFLETFKFLKYLNLSFNHFQGKVPTKGIFAHANLFSVIGNKNLCGGISKLNLPSCDTINVVTRKHHLLTVVVIIAVSVAMCFVIFISIFSIWRYKPYKLFSSIKRITRHQDIKVSYAELLRATDGFAPRNLIGAGNFGFVYKGNMEFYYGHENIAIKVFNLQQFGASRSFDIECKVLRSIRHRNLLKVLTSCSSTDYEGNDFKALIFQFMPNGSLDEWLHPQSHDNRRSLTLIQRINIAIDVACALEYLHRHGPMPIIHCDLKPSNILLDHDMVAHVGDFGMAKLLTEFATTSSQISSQSISLKGTIGYIPPEYGMGNQVSIKGDVYSFGILLLEMFTGKRPTDKISFKDHDIHHFVQLALFERVTDILDPQLLSQEEDVKGNNEIQRVNNISKYGLECIVSLLQIGLRCSNELPAERMEIEKASKELHNIKNVFLKQELAMC